MQYLNLLKEFLIVTAIYLGGDFLARHFQLSLPGNVLGMIILVCLLLSGILKMSNVERAAKLLLDNLALFFVPSGVGLMLYFNLISAEFAAIAITTVLSTFLVIGITGKFVEAISSYVEKRDSND